ncbi:MAG: glycoside hydrolase family 27 protein [Bacteroidota bacterium]
MKNGKILPRMLYLLLQGTLSAVCTLLFVASAPGQQTEQQVGRDATGPIAPSPPMGWNSWDVYGTSVTEEQVKATADAMALHLARFGWQYIVVDIEWYAPGAHGHTYDPGAELTMDGYGRLMPAVNRFPSSAQGQGFKPLADYVHAKGLKFGIHIMRGIPRQAVAGNLPVKGTSSHAADVADLEDSCRWNPDMWGIDVTKSGAQEYYNSIAELYASWGVDFVKADDMGSHLYHPSEIKALSIALRSTGRPIVLSISPGPAPVSEAAFFQKYATMWRISDDFWDDWNLLKQQFDYTSQWAPYIGLNGTWPDADMLPLGQLRMTDAGGAGSMTKFTPDEQRTVMTLWSIFRSPLIFGGNLVGLDSATLALLTNPEVLAVNQHSTGNRTVSAGGNLVVWTAAIPGSEDRYVAVFNTGETPRMFTLAWQELGIQFSRLQVRDLWSRDDLGLKDQLTVDLRPHASALYRISP